MPEVTPTPVDDVTLARLLGISGVSVLTVILGRPTKDITSMQVKKFSKRVQRGKRVKPDLQ